MILRRRLDWRQLVTVLLALAVSLGSASAADPPPLVLTPVAPGVYAAIGGEGGNSGVIIGRNGVVVIDSKQTAASGKQMLERIAALTSKPVTHVILTHSDGDHVNGLVSFPAGVQIVAHAGTQAEMNAAPASGRGALQKDRMPSRVVAGRREVIDIDGVRFELLHWAPAHTSGDLIVHLPQTHVVFTGDIVSMARPDPTIHLGKGGRADGWVETMRGILALKNVSVFVPGHGDIQDRRALERRYEATAKKRDATLAMRSHGKTLDEVLDAQPDGSGPIVRQAGFAEPGFVEVVFRELPIPAVR